MLNSTGAAGRELEGTVIKGFNSRLVKKITSFGCYHPGVRRLGLLV